MKINIHVICTLYVLTQVFEKNVTSAKKIKKCPMNSYIEHKNVFFKGI
jgi:hypothetical protein